MVIQTMQTCLLRSVLPFLNTMACKEGYQRQVFCVGEMLTRKCKKIIKPVDKSCNICYDSHVKKLIIL